MNKIRAFCILTISFLLGSTSFCLFADTKNIDSRFFQITKAIKNSQDIIYAVAIDDGIIVSTDGGMTWQRKNKGLAEKVVYPFNGKAIEDITSLGYNPANEDFLFCTTATEVYVSKNSGHNWENIPLVAPVSKNDYITSVCQSPFNKETYIISTSFSGIFETTNNGKTWNEVSPDKIIYRGSGFQEEIASVVYSPTDKGVLFIAKFGNATGSFLFKACRGLDIQMYETDAKSSSISTETTFKDDVLEKAIIESTFLDLSHQIMFRSMKEKKKSRGIQIKIRFSDFSYTTAQKTLDHFVFSAEEIFSCSLELFYKRWNGNTPIRLVGVGLISVEAAEIPEQMNLFEDGFEKKKKVEEAVFNLKNKGEKITKASLLKKNDEL